MNFDYKKLSIWDLKNKSIPPPKKQSKLNQKENSKYKGINNSPISSMI